MLKFHGRYIYGCPLSLYSGPDPSPLTFIPQKVFTIVVKLGTFSPIQGKKDDPGKGFRQRKVYQRTGIRNP